MINEPPDSRYGPPPSGSTKETTSLLEAGPMLPVPVATAQVARLAEEQNQPARAIDEQLMHRIEKLPREAGWALVTAGVIGLIAPGVVGFPFVVAGAVVLTPGGPRKLAHWASRKPRKYPHAALRQICRLVDDLERRYPRAGADTPRLIVDHRRQLDV
jgi:hypothetical protein